MEINNIGKMLGVGGTSAIKQVNDDSKIAINFKNSNMIPNCIFNGEEQHILGILANAQNNVIIED